MKANGAPEKIWINQSDLPKLSGYIDKDSVEYVRTDAFIEKAWKWIEDNILSSNQQDKSRLYFEQFKKYMKESKV